MTSPYRFGQASGVKQLPIKPYTFGQASAPLTPQEDPEEDLQPASEGVFGWLGHIGDAGISSIKQAEKIGSGVIGAVFNPNDTQSMFSQLWDSINIGAHLNEAAQPLMIKGEDGKFIPNPESPWMGKVTKKLAADEEATPGVIEQYSQIFQDANGPIEGAAKFINELGKGLYQQVVTDPLTALSGNKPILGGGIKPATPEEQYAAIVNTTATAVMMGVSGAVSKKLLAGMGTDASLMPTLSTSLKEMRVGRLGKAMGAEATGFLVGGVAGSMVKGEDVTLKSATNMILSPASVVFATLGVFSKTSELAHRQMDLEVKRVANMELGAAEYAAANSITAKINSTPAELAAGVGKLATTDNLIHAAIEARLEVGTGFLVPKLGEVEHFTLVEHYRYNTPAKNPEPSMEIGKRSAKPLKGKTFESNFDQAAYKLGATKSEAVAAQILKELKASTGLDEAALKSHAAKMQVETLKAIPNADGKIFVKATNFDPYFGRPEKQPFIYRGPNGETYVAPGVMAPKLVKAFETTGFFPEEVVSVSGKDAVLKKWNKTYSVVDYGLGDKRVLTSNLVRKVSDQLTTSILGVNDPANPLAPKMGMQLGALTPESFMNKIYGEFRASLDTDYASFNENLLHHMDANKIPLSDRGRVQQYFYKKLGDEAFQTHSPEEQYILNNAQRDIQLQYDNVEKSKYASTAHSAMTNGMHFEQDSQGYVLKDIRTNDVIRRFNTLSEIKEFTTNAGQSESIYVDGGGTGKGEPAVARLNRQLPWYWTTGTRGHLGSLLMPVRKQIEWMGVDTGDPAIGSRLQAEVQSGTLKYNSFITHEALTLKNQHEGLMKMGLAPEESANVARLLNARSLEALRSDITPEQALYAEKIVKLGDIEKVKDVILARLRKSDAEFAEYAKMKSIDPKTIAIADELQSLAASGDINHNVMRYATALNNPELALSAENLRVKLREKGEWTEKTGAAENLARSFFDEGARVFKIPAEDFIKDYLPVMLDYGKEAPRINSKWIKNSGMKEEFIHELKRAGWTPVDKQILDIESIMHKYLVTGARVESGMSASMNNALKMKEEWVKGLQNSGIQRYESSANLVNEKVDTWLNSIKNVPDAEGQALMGAGVKFGQRATSLAADWFSLVYLGARPVMAAMDAASTFIIASSKYGFNLTKGMTGVIAKGDFSERLRSLEARGKIPQFSASSILSRADGETTIISKAADLGIKLSLQESAYKYSFGSTYLATLDAVNKAHLNSGGNIARVKYDLGDILEGNNPAVKARFNELMQNNQAGAAAEFLALSNAGSVSNMFGKINNPLKWQNSVGRLAGQFGSWSVNAGTSLIEMYAQQNWSYIARATSRMTATNALVYVAANALGIGPAKFMVHPGSLLPGLGPMYSTYDDIRQGFQAVIGSENETNYGQSRLERVVKNATIPLIAKNAYAAYEYYAEQDAKFQAFMKMMGFKVVDR